MFAQWSQPIQEENYIRVVYIGKLRLVSKSGEKLEKKPTLEDMINDIWKGASEYNRRNNISGYLTCAKTLHVVQLLEGEEDVIFSLMERIRRDLRLVIYKEFVKKHLPMHVGWAISMCYSFEITSGRLEHVQDSELTIEEMFDMMKNTDEVRQESLSLPMFYKEIMETILLKFITSTEDEYITSTEDEALECERGIQALNLTAA